LDIVEINLHSRDAFLFFTNKKQLKHKCIELKMQTCIGGRAGYKKPEETKVLLIFNYAVSL